MHEAIVLPMTWQAQLRVQRVTYQGHERIHARLWYRNAAGQWRPSKKGLALPPELAAQVARAMLKAAGALDRTGG